MWRCSGSDQGAVRAFARIAALALIAGLVAGPADAQRRRGADTVSTAREIRISDEGVHILPSTPVDGPPERIEIEAGGVRIRARGDEIGEGKVRISGPVVVVDDATGIVRVFSDARVDRDEHVDGDVVAVFGSVDVHGSVAGDVVAVFGSVHLHDSTTVSGDVVAVGGTLDQAPTAVITGESVSLDFFPVAWSFPTVTVLLGTVAMGWALSVFMGWLLALLFPRRIVRVAETASQRTLASFLLGVLSVPLFVVLLALLFITVIGIPLAILLPIFYVLLVWAGKIVAGYVLGCRILRRGLGEGGLIGPIVAGMTLVAAFFVAASLLATPPGVLRTIALFLALVGVLLATALASIGTGAFLLARGGRGPEAAPGPAAPAPAPAAGPAPGGVVTPPAGS